MAYAFLTAPDVLSRIRDEHRADLSDSTEAVELSCESMAIAKVKSALHGRYDAAAVFAETGSGRDPLIVLHVLNVFVYMLYQRINPRKIPEQVKDDHAETLDWLERVTTGKESPDLPAKPEPGRSTTDLRSGGGLKVRGTHF